MTICIADYRSKKLAPLEKTTYQKQGLKEPDFLHPILKNSIGKGHGILDDCMVVAEEFDEWNASSRSVDLLAVDREANLVVIEVKRSKGSGHTDHAELQAIRYAAMISKITFDKIVEVRQKFMKDNGIVGNARSDILKFFGWSAVDENLFGQKVKIVIAASEFSDELATSVMWLRNTCNLDIKCMKMEPWLHNRRLLIDTDIVIPAAETAVFDFKSDEKKQKERQSTSNKDHSRYDVSVNGKKYGKKMHKNKTVHTLIKVLVNKHKCLPHDIDSATTKNLFFIIPEEMNAADAYNYIADNVSENRAGRFYCNQDDDIFRHGGKTYLVTNGWELAALEDVLEELKEKYPSISIEVVKSDAK